MKPVWFDVRHPLRTAGWLVATLLVSACGGGGSSDGDGGGATSSASSATPQIVATPVAITRTVAVNDASAPVANISFEFRNMPSSVENFAAARLVTGALSGHSWVSFSSTAGTVQVSFDAPSSLPPGIYTDRIRVFACTSLDCSSVLDGVEAIVPIEYTVTSPVVAPVVAFSRNSIQVTALHILDQPQQQQVAITLQNFGVTPYVTVSFTAQQVSGISEATAEVSNPSTGTLNVRLLPPNTLSKGTYSGVVSVTVCLDPTCVNPVSGSPFSIPVTYVVGDAISVGGAYGYQLRVVHLPVQGLTVNPVSGLLYVALPGDANGPGYVAALNADTGVIGTKVETAAATNGVMDVSADGTYLYVALGNGTLVRYDLPGLTPNLTIPLGVSIDGDQRYAADIQVSPVSRSTIAVSFASGSSLVGFGNLGAGLFDNAVQRPNTVLGNSTQGYGTPVDRLAWNAAGDFIYSTHDHTLHGVNTLLVASNGLSVSNFAEKFVYGRPLFANDLIYTDNGEVYSPMTNAFLTPYTPLGTGYLNSNLTVDAVLGRLYVIGPDPDHTPYGVIRSSDLASRQVLADVELPHVLGSYVRESTLQRWGGNGLVFYTPNDVAIVTGDFVTH